MGVPASEAASLGRRFLAAVIDRAPFVILMGLWAWLFFVVSASGAIVYTTGLLILAAAVALVQWYFYGVRTAGLGYHLCGLQLVRERNREPLGWGWMILRTLVSYALWLFIFPGIVMCLFLVTDQRRRGWHDMASGAMSVRRAEPQRPAVPSVAARTWTDDRIADLPDRLFKDARPPSWEPSRPAAPKPADGWAPPQGHSMPTQPQTPQQNPWVTPQPKQPDPIAHVPWSQSPYARKASTPKPPESRKVPVPQRQKPSMEDATRLVAPPKRAVGQWRVVLDNGKEAAVDPLVLVGRDPKPRESDPDSVVLLGAGQPSDTVSKTHLAIGVDENGAYVSDRTSTNGTAIVGPSGSLKPCSPEERVSLQPGQRVSFGSRSLTVYGD